MKIIKIKTISDLILKEGRVVALGLFETMHRGHKKLIEKAYSLANENNYLTTVVTVSQSVNKKGFSTFNLDHRIEKINELNVDELIIIEMNEIVQKSSADEFVSLLKRINTKLIVTGSDYRFGYLGMGDVKLLQNNFNVNVVEFELKDGQKISTTTIKNELKHGKITHVNNLLGYNYYIKGKVDYGKQLGRTIGVPTTNIYPKISPLETGVYLTKTLVAGTWYRSITNIGYNPTIGNNDLSIETYIGDGFNEDIYGYEIKVEMLEKIRDEVKFETLDELVNRLKLDIKYMEEHSYENY